MTASELAFLALGLCLGGACGAALLLVVGRGTGRRDVRVTVTREAVPSRSRTLSQDAFLPPSTGPAPGGPGDRRTIDRTGSGTPDGVDGAGRRAPVGIPIEVPVGLGAAAPFAPPAPAADRTIVPSRPAVAIEIRPETAAAPTSRPAHEPVGVAARQPVGEAARERVGEPVHEPARDLDGIRRRATRGMPIERMLRGEHFALIEVVDEVAGTGPGRRDWEVLLGGLIDGMATIAVRESVIDFPMGAPFWDQFTVEQCRRIAGSLASMGYRYDGADGWSDARVPVYRDVTRALADVGIEPRRLRAWPNQAEIASLFVGARPAPEELLAAAGPEYSAGSMQTLLAEHAAGLADLWIAWDAVRPILFREDSVLDAAVPEANSAI